MISKKMHKRLIYIPLIALVFIAMALLFYQIWIIHIDGPGFRKKTVKSTRTDSVASHKVQMSFLGTGHVRDGARLYNNVSDLNEMLARKKVFPMLSKAFLNSINKINKLDLDYVFITGDVTALEYPLAQERLDRRIEEDFFRLCWDQILNQLEQIDPDVVIAPGNHDIFNWIGAKVYTEIVGNPFRSFSSHGVRFVILNSSKIEPDISENYVGPEFEWSLPERLSAEQIEFLRNGISAEWKENNIFIFIHHDPQDIPQWGVDVHPILQGSNCRVVFSGTNWGTLKYRKIDGIHYFDSGFDGSETFPNYYLIITLFENDDIEFSVLPMLPTSLSTKTGMAFRMVKRVINSVF